MKIYKKNNENFKKIMKILKKSWKFYKNHENFKKIMKILKKSW
jgi:hypothetical protein